VLCVVANEALWRLTSGKANTAAIVIVKKKTMRVAITCSDMHPTTTKFQQSLPYAVLHVSPSLAALYTTRAQSFTHSDSCSKCGSYLLNGNATIRVVRLTRPRARAMRRTCHACGWSNDLLIDTENPASSPHASVELPSSITQEPILKSRSKKKSGLQNMLSRSREKKKEEQSCKDDGQVGLAAFLAHL